MPSNPLTQPPKLKSTPPPAPLTSINILFFTSKLFGLVPYSLADFISKQKLDFSPFGNVFCLLSCTAYALAYHLIMNDTIVTFQNKSSRVTSLTEVIGLIIIYFEPFMMIIDVLASIVNQSGLIEVFQRLQNIDEKLANENIFINYKFVRKFSIYVLLFAFILEIGLSMINFFLYIDDFTLWVTFLWILSSFPLLINFIAKTWFLCLILMIRQRLRAINGHMSEMADEFGERKVKIGKNEFFVQTVEFLRNEMGGGRVEKGKKFQIVKAFEGNRGKMELDINLHLACT
jgi:7tm Chemosensory receptor